MLKKGKKDGRIYHSKKNIIIGLLSQILTVLVAFITRTVFIKVLGLEYLGISNVFASVLTILSVAELGVGEAIAFALYKPLAENDENRIKQIMNMFKKTYLIISIIIIILGMVLIPFLKYIIGNSSGISNIYIIYILYVINSAITYMCSYKKILLIADQKKYVESIITTILTLLMHLAQIVLLLFVDSYIAYFVIQIIFNFLINITLSVIVDKRYPYIKCNNTSVMDKTERKTIYKNFLALAIQKVNGVIAQSIDSIILSTMLGTIIVGKYSNYLMIEKYITQFVVIIFVAITGSVGNLIAKESKEKQFDIFKKINLLSFWVFSVTTICYCVSANSFMIFWLEDETFLLDFSIILVISLNHYVLGVRQAVTLFKNAYGLYWQDRFKPIFSAIVNIVFSIILTKYFGIIGVCLGTLFAYLLVNTIVEPIVLFKYGFKENVFKYYIDYLIKFGFVIVSCVLIFVLTKSLEVENTFLKFIVIGTGTFTLLNVLYLIVFHKSKHFKYYVNIVKNVLGIKITNS